MLSRCPVRSSNIGAALPIPAKSHVAQKRTQHSCDGCSSATLTRSTIACFLLLAQLPPLPLQHSLHLVQHLHLLRRALAVLGPVGRGDDDGFVRDHLGVVPADGDVAVGKIECQYACPLFFFESVKSRSSDWGICSHSLQRVVNRLRLLAHAFTTIRGFGFQLRDARALALFQAFGIYGCQRRLLLLGSERCDLEVLHARDGDDVVVAGVAAGGGLGVDCHEAEDGACGEEGAFEGLRLRSGGGELDAGEENEG